MLSSTPVNSGKVRKEDTNREILRLAIIGELDAISLYEQLADTTDDRSIKTILMDIAKEEKTHVGELQALLNRCDKEQEAELESGKKEVEEKTK